MEEELYRGVISGHEMKQKQLVVENHELCEIVTYLLTELSTLIHSCSQSLGCDQQHDKVFLSLTVSSLSPSVIIIGLLMLF